MVISETTVRPKNGLSVSRRVNAMANLYEWVSTAYRSILSNV